MTLQENSSMPQPNTRRDALRGLRQRENELLDADRRLRLRLAITNAIIGAMIGMLIGYLGTAIAIVDDGIGDFGFRFFRPSLDLYLRVSTAYFIPGALIGGISSYLLFTGRTEIKSPIRWISTWLILAPGIPLLIGFFLPVTFVVFVDFWEGLRPGLWASAIVENFLRSFVDGFIYMVSVLYAGLASAVAYIVISIVCVILWIKDPIPSEWTRSIPAPAYYYAFAFCLSASPLVIMLFGPFNLLRAVTAFLTGENV